MTRINPIENKSEISVDLAIVSASSFHFSLSWLLKMYYYILFGMLSVSVTASHLHLDKFWVI